jgi:N-acetylglutamate synthase-like GNAT family acetyltransferase
MDKEIEIVACKSEKDFQDYSDSFNNNDLPKSIELVNWFHKHNPLHENVVDFAVANNEDGSRKIAAIYAVFPVKFNVFGKIVKAVQSIDTLTDIDFRGKGLFIKLAKNVYNRAKNENYHLVYGFPNGSSAHGFFKKLGWKEIADVPFMIKPLRSNYFSELIAKKWNKFIPNVNLSRIKNINMPKGFSIKRINNNDIDQYDFTAVWKDFSNDKLIAIERNNDYIKWRIGQKPDENYSIDGLFIDAKLIGYIIYAVKDKHNGKIGYILDFIFCPAYKNQSSVLLQHALNNIKKDKADLVLCWSLDHAENHSIFRKKYFFKMPKKLRPIALHFGACSLDDNNDIFNKNNWYLSYFDSDTV